MIIINPSDGKVVSRKVFDTFKSSEELDTFITSGSIPSGYIVAAGCQDECATRFSEVAKQWVADMGSEEIWYLKYRQSFAFICQTDCKLMHESKAKT